MKSKTAINYKVLYCVNGVFVNKEQYIKACKDCENALTLLYCKSKSLMPDTKNKNNFIIFFNLEF